MKKLMMFVIVIGLINNLSCSPDKDEENLPQETQVGANTLGCLINGKIWLPKGLVTFPSPNLQAQVSQTYFYISALKEGGDFITIEINESPKIGVFNLNDSNHTAYMGNSGTNCYYKTDSESLNNYIEITKFDTVNYIISGRFEFTAFKFQIEGLDSSSECDSIKKITEGRFDIKYIP